MGNKTKMYQFVYKDNTNKEDHLSRVFTPSAESQWFNPWSGQVKD